MIVLNLQPPLITAVFLLTKTMGENIMSDNKRQKLRRAILRDEFDTFITAGRLLKNSRAILGVQYWALGQNLYPKKWGLVHDYGRVMKMTA